jgi:hypothetical protein
MSGIDDPRLKKSPPTTHAALAGLGVLASEQVAPAESPAAQIKHDYPACAIFRGGKCTCDEADKLCPQCGSEEWDRVDSERGRERDVPFNRCYHCAREWNGAAA